MSAVVNGMSEKDKVMDKITKLLKLSEGTHSQDEAQTAMLKVQELLSTYNLTMSEVEKTTGKSERKNVLNEFAFSRTRMPWWWKNIAMVLAENFRCYVYLDSYYDDKIRERGHSIRFIGLEHDVVSCISTANFAIKVAEQCWKDYKSNITLYRTRGGRNRGAGIKNDYLKGFIQGLKLAFAEQVTTKDLIIVKDALVTREYAKLHLGKGQRSSHATARDTTAYDKGLSDGQSVRKDRYIE